MEFADRCHFQITDRKSAKREFYHISQYSSQLCQLAAVRFFLRRTVMSLWFQSNHTVIIKKPTAGIIYKSGN